MNTFAQLKAELHEMTKPFAEANDRRYEERVRIMQEKHKAKTKEMFASHDKRAAEQLAEFEQRSLINQIKHRIEVVKSRLHSVDISIFPADLQVVVNAIKNHSVEEILKDCLSSRDAKELIESIYDSIN